MHEGSITNPNLFTFDWHKLGMHFDWFANGNKLLVTAFTDAATPVMEPLIENRLNRGRGGGVEWEWEWD